MKIREVPLSKVRLPEGFAEIERHPLVDVLVESITDNRLIEPVVLTPDFQIIAGRKRIAAFRRLRCLKVPAIIREDAIYNGAKKATIAENLHREHLDKSARDALIAEYAAVSLLKAPSKWGKSKPPTKKAVVEKIADETGVSPRTVERALLRPERAASPKRPQLPKGWKDFGLTMDDGEIRQANAAIGLYADAREQCQKAGLSIAALTQAGILESTASLRLARVLREVEVELESETPIGLCESCKKLEGVVEECGACHGSGFMGKAARGTVDKRLNISGANAMYLAADGKLRKVSEWSREPGADE